MRLLILLISFFFSNVLLADNLSDSNTLFDFVEESYSPYFSPAGAETFTGDSESGQYLARYYEETETYVATLGEEVYVFGEVWGLVQVGIISDFVDVIPPVIQILGSSPLTIFQNAAYEDAGATATDNIDGNLDVSSSGTVDASLIGAYAITYTATDSAGNIGTAIREVNVSGPYGINVSLPTGHTASFNAIAEFQVSLISRPSSDVIIPVVSSDANEGVTTVESITFTPENWAFAQAVVIKGRNPDVIDGEQDYQIILAPAESDDSIYNGLNADDVAMQGIVLNLLEPNDSLALISELESTIFANAVYTGSKQLSYSLAEKPDDMVIDLRSGEITWVPPISAEGEIFPITMKVTDGILFAEVSFNVVVAVGNALQVDVQAETLTITEGGNSLNGLALTVLVDRASLGVVNVNTINDEIAADIPDYINKLTDIFTVTPVITGDIEVRFPQSLLPENASIFDLKLFHYTNDLKGRGAAWTAIGTGFDLEGSANDPVVLIRIHNMEGLYFIGLQAPEAPPEISRATKAARSINSRSVSLLNISCTPFEKKFSGGGASTTYKIQDCKIAGSNNSFRIEGFANADDTASRLHWGDISIADFVVWLTEVQDQFSTLGLQYKAHIEVVIEARNGFGAYDGTKLHINSAYTKGQQRNTLAHEYFHHAELETLTAGANDAEARSLRYWQVDGNWIWEGMAYWFEDYFDDASNLYLADSVSRKPAPRVLEQGINTTNSYDMFLFWKLLQSKCGYHPDLELADIFSGVMDATWGAGTLQTTLAASSCDFGDQLGNEKKSSLAAALLYYQYATLYKNKISLLDTNETDTDFKFQSTPFEYSLVDWSEENEGSAVTIGLDNISKIPAYGAYSIRLNADVFTHENLDTGHEAVFRLVSSLPLTVSLLSDDPGFIGNSQLGGIQHKHYQSNEQTEYLFNENDQQGDFFITLLNSSDTDVSISELGFAIRIILTEELEVTVPAEGAEVNQRVITVSGEVPETATNVDRVIVSNGDIKTVTTIAADKTFTADVVVTMGSNTLIVQGYNSSNLHTPLTKEKIINVIGVESASTGQNALVPSRIALVLRWATNGTDIDIYSTDKNDETIWYGNRSVLPGFLDHDDTSGLGPEVISYQDTGDDIYNDGTFDIDIHYFSGSAATAYSLDVIMNENSPNQIIRHYESTQSLPNGNSSEDGPTGSGNSRFNDVLSIICNDQKICSIGRVDLSKFSGTNDVTQQGGEGNGQFVIQPRSAVERGTLEQDADSYDKCTKDYNSNMNKTGKVAWECDLLSGAKIWN